MKVQATLLAALVACAVEAHEGHDGDHHRFGTTIFAQNRTVTGQSSVNNERTITYRPANTSFDIKNTFSVSTQTAGFLNHEVFNKTSDNTPSFAYRVGILRVAEVYDDKTGLTTDKFLNLNSTNGTWSFVNVNDRTDIESRSARWTESNPPTTTPATPATVVTVLAELALKNVTDTGIARTPYEIKWDLNVENYRHTHTGDSKLAVVVSIQSVQAKELMMDGTTITGVKIGGGNGTVTWVPQVTVGNENKTVAVTDLGAGTLLDQSADTLGEAGETSHYLQFTIDGNQTTGFVWDPTNALNEDQIVGNSAGKLTMSLAFVAATLAYIVM